MATRATTQRGRLEAQEVRSRERAQRCALQARHAKAQLTALEAKEHRQRLVVLGALVAQSGLGNMPHDLLQAHLVTLAERLMLAGALEPGDDGGT